MYLLNGFVIIENLIVFCIGLEIGNNFLEDMSMIIVMYEVLGYGKGIIVLLGLISMLYLKIFGLVDMFWYELVL